MDHTRQKHLSTEQNTTDTNNAHKTTYHHGDLLNALLCEGRKILVEAEINEFSLREIASRVGFSGGSTRLSLGKPYRND